MLAVRVKPPRPPSALPADPVDDAAEGSIAPATRSQRWRQLARFWSGIVALALLTCAATLLALATIPAPLPGWSATVVGSGSMSPALVVGDVVALQEVPPGHNLAAPSVVLIKQPAGPDLLHRVVASDPARGYQTRGDANDSADSDYARPDQILGIGRFVVPFVGWPSLWSAAGNYLALAGLAVAIAVLVRVSRYGLSDEYDPWASADTHTDTDADLPPDEVADPEAEPLWHVAAPAGPLPEAETPLSA